MDIPTSFQFSGDAKDLFLQTNDEYHLIGPEDSILIAVSGGPDSVALCRILYALKTRLSITMGLAHFNHLLREDESERDEQFVMKLADTLDLPFFSRQADVKAYAKTNKLSIETAGRKLRYAFFNEIAEANGYSKIATGHTRDDNAEQILMNLLRGSGSDGLSGIPPMRDERIIRPLIQFSKKSIYALLEASHHPFMVDSSNLENTFLRNRVRNGLIPLLEKEYNPEIKESLLRLSQVIKDETLFVQDHARQALDDCRMESNAASLTLSKKLFHDFHPALQKRILRLGIQQVKGDLKAISWVHLNSIIDFCIQKTPGKSLDLPGQIRIYKAEKSIMIKKEAIPLRDMGKLEKEKKRFEKQAQNRQNQRL